MVRSHDNSSFGSCSSFLAPHTDEAISASSRMAQDVDEAKSESSWNALAKGRKETGGALEGEVEKLEVIGLWSRTEGDSVDPQGEMGRRSARVKAAKMERGDWKEGEMEVDGEAPQRESAEMQSPERKVIRVESEETQDYVCGLLSISREETEELAFVPSVLSEPRGPTCWCDNRCSEKDVRY